MVCYYATTSQRCYTSNLACIDKTRVYERDLRASPRTHEKIYLLHFVKVSIWLDAPKLRGTSEHGTESSQTSKEDIMPSSAPKRL